MSRVRRSTSPSVNSSSWSPGSSRVVASSYGLPDAAPSSTPLGCASWVASPSRTRMGARLPAWPQANTRVSGSRWPMIAVAVVSFSWCMTRSFSQASSRLAPCPVIARPTRAWRRWAMREIAGRPCPEASPIASSTRPSGAGAASNQSPPRLAVFSAGTYRTAILVCGRSRQPTGSGRIASRSASITWRSSAARSRASRSWRRDSDTMRSARRRPVMSWMTPCMPIVPPGPASGSSTTRRSRRSAEPPPRRMRNSACTGSTPCTTDHSSRSSVATSEGSTCSGRSGRGMGPSPGSRPKITYTWSDQIVSPVCRCHSAQPMLPSRWAWPSRTASISASCPSSSAAPVTSTMISLSNAGELDNWPHTT